MFMQQDDANKQIHYNIYWSVFHYHFNLGFGSPATDVCSTCVSYKLKAKQESITPEEKAMLITSLEVHRRKARMFYTKLNTPVDDSLTICFDLMENLPLPRTPIGQAYYSRQLYVYVFGVVIHSGIQSSQSLNEVLLYTWREDQNKKDSNVVASAINHALLNPLAAKMTAAKTLRLFSDSCFGQNKNMAMMTMLMSHIARRHRTRTKLGIEYTFPVRGHSYLPADRVFGRVEQDIRKKGQIILPSTYLEILKRHGTVFEYGKDWQVHDIKKEVKRLTKTARSFKLSEAREIKLANTNLLIRDSYNGVFKEHSVLKRGQSISTFNPPLLPPKSYVKDAKKRDVRSLLLNLGVGADVTELYDEMLQTPSNNTDSESE